MKYKVGDKVRIRKDLKIYEEYDGTSLVDKMLLWKGKKVTILKVCSDYNGYEIEEDGGRFLWTDSMFEDAMTNADKIRNVSDEEINMSCKIKDRCPSYSIWCEGVNEPDADCISDILTVYENEKKKIKDLECLYRSPFERASWVDFDAVEKALGFRLFGYQKSYILGQGFRQMGRTTAEILEQLLDKRNWNKPIDLSNPTSNQKLILRQQFRDIWEKLKDAKIPMRTVFWTKKDKNKYELERKIPKKEIWDSSEFLSKHLDVSVPDCNDCVYLNFTEKEQQVYEINSHKKDHRCKYYGRPVYHKTYSKNHDSYIYPCNECQKDDFINYYDWESIEKK